MTLFTFSRECQEIKRNTYFLLSTHLFETFPSLLSHSLSEGIVFIAAGEELPTWEGFAL